MNNQIAVYGHWEPATTAEIDYSSEKLLYVRLRLAIHDGLEEDHVSWHTWPVDNNGNFDLSFIENISQAAGASFTIQAWFDRTDLLSSSVSMAINFKQQKLA